MSPLEAREGGLQSHASGFVLRVTVVVQIIRGIVVYSLLALSDDVRGTVVGKHAISNYIT